MATNEKTVPPPPITTPIADSRGIISQPWFIYFRQVFLRIGEARAMTNVELESSFSQGLADITALQTSVTALQSAVTALQSKDNDFSQGRQL